MWQICIDIARHAQQWVSSIALTAASGNESLAATYIIGISAAIVTIIAVLVIVSLRYTNRLADDGIYHVTFANAEHDMIGERQ